MPDPSLACANDIINVTPEERLKFKYGMVMQVDRSQGHLKQADDGLNASIANINSGGPRSAAGVKKRHFRHTFQPLPAPYTHWRECREALCQPGCVPCMKAVENFGHHPTFQSVGKKGSKKILEEMGIKCDHLLAPAKAKLLNEQANWGDTTPAICELFQNRGHYCLIGVACHAELACKEHGWARLKTYVRPYVNGQYVHCTELIAGAIQKIGQKARLEDARRCRDVMHAYRALAAAETLATEQEIKLWTKKHKRHRGVHESETSDLLMQAGMRVSAEKMSAVKRCKTQGTNVPIIASMKEAGYKKIKQLIRKRSRTCSYDEAAKLNAKMRKDKHNAKATCARKPVQKPKTTHRALSSE